MIVVYYSRFKNTKAFVSKLNVNNQSIDEYDGENDYVLITPTYGIGEVPDEVTSFLEKNHKKMVAVISSGNRNWGLRFANSGRIIHEIYGVPWLYRFELRGYDEDVDNIRKVLENLNGKEKKLH